MIALCREHADKADNGAFTDDQLRELKRVGNSRAAQVRGRFDWMRQDLLAVVGGNFYYGQPLIFRIGDVPCVWFDRDEDEYLLLNFKMPTISGLPRARVDQNFWSVSPAVDEVICPPSGRLVEVKYPDGDKFRAEFFNCSSADELENRYPPKYGNRFWYDDLQFPLTVVELSETAAGTNIEFGPMYSQLGGIQLEDCYFSENGGAGIQLDVGAEQQAILFPVFEDSEGL